MTFIDRCSTKADFPSLWSRTSFLFDLRGSRRLRKEPSYSPCCAGVICKISAKHNFKRQPPAGHSKVQRRYLSQDAVRITKVGVSDRSSGHFHLGNTQSKSNTASRSQLAEKEFVQIIVERLRVLARESQNVDFQDFENISVTEFTKSIGTLRRAGRHGDVPGFFEPMRQAYKERGQVGLDAQLKYMVYGLRANREFSRASLGDLKKLADLRYPVEWYPSTRRVQRTIHLHVGPTNSGKTYHALKRLEQAESGLYAGPLRLLAHEVYVRLNAQGKSCHLVTGDERQIKEDEGTAMTSCTVEMASMQQNMEVAVIDEIQMIGDKERGWAWTQALLGLKAKELHLCGEERTVPLIRELAAAVGDKLEVHNYKRLSPLKSMSTSLQGRYRDLRKGDCVVVFSRMGIHAMKATIERQTGKRVAVIYGSLPPETRTQQARLFNDPDNEYDILVASDAIGMGLNLSIKRIIFESTSKFNGKIYETIPVHHIKQIAGRAGRYRVAPQSKEPAKTPSSNDLTDFTKSPETQATDTAGLVTTLDRMDLPVVRKAMISQPEPILTAGLFPPTNILLEFATYFPPSTPFSYILLRLHELSIVHPRFHLCNLKDQIGIADAIDPIKDLTIEDRIIFCASPASMREPAMPPIIQAYARCVANNGAGSLLDIPELDLDLLDIEVSASKVYLSKLEILHKALILYLWLSYRFAGVFSTQGMAFYVKSIVEAKIDKCLEDFSASPKIRERIRSVAFTARQKAILRDLRSQIGSNSEKEATIPLAEDDDVPVEVSPESDLDPTLEASAVPEIPIPWPEPQRLHNTA